MRTRVYSTVLIVIALAAILWLNEALRSSPPGTTSLSNARLVEPIKTNHPSGNPPPSQTTNLTPTQISQVMKQVRDELAKQGFYTDLADIVRDQDSGEYLWKFIGDPSRVMDCAVGYLLEPFPPRTLDALDHVLKHSKKASERLTAETLLYRYGRESGRTALLELLKQGGTDVLTISAAITLARNKDQGGLVDSLALLNRLSEFNPSLLHVLGSWNEPSITQALTRQQQLAPKHKYWAYALAYQDNPLGLPALQAALAAEKNSLNYVSIRIEAATARLGATPVEDFQRHFKTMYQQNLRFGRELIATLEQAGPRVGGPEMLWVLKDFIPRHEQWIVEGEIQAQKVKAKDPTAYHSYPKPVPFTYLPGAANFLAEWNVREAVPLLEGVISQLQKGQKVFNDLNQQLGLALYRLDPVGWRDTLFNVGIRLDHIDRIPEIAKLRPVAHEQMPQQKNLYWR